MSSAALPLSVAPAPTDPSPNTPTTHQAIHDSTNGLISPYSQVDSPSHSSPADTPSETHTPDGFVRPKQKRNKPTLSCEECVERKTKCDRTRPTCLSCVKRQTECHYTHAAVTGPKPPAKARKLNATSSPGLSISTDGHGSGANRPAETLKREQRSPAHPSPSLLSSLPFSESSPSNIFGVGADFPFSNYWTCAGGIAEVVGVLPSKQQADILVNKYFEVVDPVYPFIHKRTFYLHYERFWASSQAVQNNAEPDLLAMHCTVYALGTQFMQIPSYVDRSQSAEFYASAACQALRLFSYLNRASLRSLAAMLLLAYFLMNDNHASDAYAWAGTLLRQAYALRLHRDPDIIELNISEMEKQIRRRLWQAVFFQDTFLTVLLKLPPTATHSDVKLENLKDEASLSADGFGRDLAFQSRVENLMSINVIAPPPNASPSCTALPSGIDLLRYNVEPQVDRADVTYIRSMWELGNLVQKSISSPLSLNIPLATSTQQKAKLISSFRSLHRSFPGWLTTVDLSALDVEIQNNSRGVRQNLFLTSNYYHCLMILHASEHEPAGVECNIRGTLEAAHDALAAYFSLARYFGTEAQVWWVFQHRAFEEALMVARLLSLPPGTDPTCTETLFAKCKSDVTDMMEMLRNSTVGHAEMQKTRLSALEAAFGRCLV